MDRSDQKYIIPDLRTHGQPGLEVVHLEPEVVPSTSPEVVSATSHGDTLDKTETLHFAASTATSHPDASLPQRVGSRGSRRSLHSSSFPASASISSSTPISGLYLRGGPVNNTPLQQFKVEEHEDHSPRKRTILGLRVLVFWIVISVFVAVIAIGLAVGLAIGLKKSDPSTSASGTTSTATPVATTVPGVPSPAPVNPWCPSHNGSVVTPYDASGTSIRFNNEFAQSFQMLCNTYYPAGQGINPGQRDIMVMYAPDMLTCITLCAEYNAGYSDAIGDDIAVGGGICVAVALVKSPTEFCYLKNATGVNDTKAANGGQPVDSAILIGNWTELETIGSGSGNDDDE